MQSSKNWDQFVQENLLASDVVDGIQLLTKQSKSLYCYGQLKGLTENDMSQFVVIFNTTNDEEDAAMCQKGFTLGFSGKEIHFTIYRKSHNSVYATSARNSQGLVVCNLPSGVLVASYSQPHTSSQAIFIVETACQVLRA